MKSAARPGFAVALQVGLLELLIVLSGLIFVRKEVYLAGQLGSMLLHWQEYALLALMFIDGIFRGFGALQAQANYLSPFRKKFLRYMLPLTLFLFVSCSSLCDKLNAACIHEEWWRDLGLVILACGVSLSAWSKQTKPKELEAAFISLVGIEASAGEEGKAAELPESTAKGVSAKPETGANELPAELKTEGPWNLLRYPGRTSILLDLVGISMILSAWMPLLTLPGLLVVFKWELLDVEAFRIS